MVAVVGEYGSGKTSLIELLCKLYQLHAGTVRVNGIDLARLVAADWHARTSAAFQDFGRFQILFGQTVGLGDVRRLVDREAVHEAVRAADADALVQRQPKVRTPSSGAASTVWTCPRGSDRRPHWLMPRCGGRRCCSYWTNPPPRRTRPARTPSSSATWRARELCARIGTITAIVSHRFSMVTDADLILVLHAGRIAESGTHDELLATGGRYAQLYGIQAKAYAAG
ncbi:ATP-binding cassette domain-containing protein [Streptomyces sp. NPDC005931]|uniref:ATP-binding cassette domain-containing protein n=1 Tax=Streptomyces sp. NPDC005931 TaxID=3364737 RepID=UPI0036992CFD